MELEVKRGDESVRIRSTAANAQDVLVPTAPIPVSVIPAAPIVAAAPIAPPATPAIPAAPPAPAPAPPPKEEEQNVLVKSPIVGTYYDAPSPNAPPFVKEGDTVVPRQVLCIIESMKLMNEIEAEIGGTVVAKHVANGMPVEYGESLFTIRPV